MPDIFLTYSRQDQDFADRIQPVLKRLHLELDTGFFRDVDDLIPGELWEDRLSEALETCSIVLALLSESYFSSKFIQETELPVVESRLDRGLLIVPVFVRPVLIPSDSVFSRVQWVNTPDQPLSSMTDAALAAFVVELEQTLRDLLQTFPRSPKSKDARYNIAVVGKSGAGKSELINYLFGSHLLGTGIGLPVTQLGFHRRDSVVADIPTSIWDSAGLEVGKHDLWLATLEDELRSRGPSEPIQKWFHTVLYCVQVTGSRIEPFEIQIINDFIRYRYKVIVVLTKAYVGTDDTLALSAAIREHVSVPISCVPVNSKHKRIGSSEFPAFGRARLVREIEVALIDSLTDRVPARCIAFAASYIDQKCASIVGDVERMLTARKKNDISDAVASQLQELVEGVKSPTGHFHQIIWREIRHTLSVYRQIAGIAEQAMAAAEVEGVIGEISDLDQMPKTKKFWRRVGDLFNDHLDWDVSGNVEGFVGSLGEGKFVENAADMAGDLADSLAKIVAVPFVALFSAAEGLADFISDHRSFAARIETKIWECNERLKEDLWDNEDSIKKTFLEYVRRV